MAALSFRRRLKWILIVCDTITALVIIGYFASEINGDVAGFLDRITPSWIDFPLVKWGIILSMLVIIFTGHLASALLNGHEQSEQ